MTACPICAEPATDDVEVCTGCGWQLRAGPFLGWAAAADTAKFDEHLERVAGDWDLAAAARSGATRAMTAALDPRGGLPTEAVWAAAIAEPMALRAAAAPGDDALAGVLARLTNRTTRMVHFVSMTCEHIAHQRVVADPAGFPVIDGGTTFVDWATATVSADPARRRFQLAGGVGADPVNRYAFDRAIARALPGLEDGQCVLAYPSQGWTLLDRARDVLGRRTEVAATIEAGPEPFDLVELTTEVLETAPLPCDYAALLQSVDSVSGAVEVVTWRLFAAGTRVVPGTLPPSHHMTLQGSPTTDDLTAVPVVACVGEDPSTWRVIAMGGTMLPSGSAARVEFTLDGLTKVRICRGGGRLVSPFGGAELPELLAAIPERVSPTPPLDLVFAVELAGTEEQVRARLTFVDRLTQLVIARRQVSQVRFGAIGYVDHRDRPTARYPSNRVVFGGGEPGSAAHMRSVLGTWEAHAPLRDAATAMEDALAKAAGLHWHRSAAADRVLVLVGLRPPAVPAATGPIPVCPHRMSWRDSLDRLRSRRVRIVGVREAGPVTTIGGPEGAAIRAYATATWRDLAGDHLFALGPDTPNAVSIIVTQRPDIPPEAFPFGLAPSVDATP